MKKTILTLSVAAVMAVGCTKGSSTPPETAVKPTEKKDPAGKLDTDQKKVLDTLGTLGGKPIETLTAEEARKQPTPNDAVKAVLTAEKKDTGAIPVGAVEEKSFEGPAGAVPARLYLPDTGKAPYPLIVYFHGGGFVIATNDTYDASARGLVKESGAAVLSVEYRKAPEAKFPAAHEDAFAGYKWALANAASLQCDPARVALAGESAGGNLALNVAIRARDEGLQAPKHILAVYPVASSNMDSPSYVAFADAKPLNKPMMKWFTEQYFNTPADGKDPRIDLVNAKLSGLSPVTIVTAEIDPLASDSVALRDALKSAGVDVTQKTWEGVAHEFFGQGAVVADAKDAMSWAGGRLKSALAESKAEKDPTAPAK